MKKLFILICAIVFVHTSVQAVDWVRTPCGSYFDKDRTFVRNNIVHTVFKDYPTNMPNTVYFSSVIIDLSKKYIHFKSSQVVEESSGKALTPILTTNSTYYASETKKLAEEIDFFIKMYGPKQ